MSSQHQLYEKTMAGFLASLDQIGESPESRSSAECSLTQPHQTSELTLSEHETRLLEEAVADIEQLMQRRSQSRRASSR